MTRYTFTFLILLHCIASAPEAKANEIIHVSKTSYTEAFAPYIKELFKLVVKETPENGPAELRASEEDMVQDRAMQALREGKIIELFWTMTSKEREQGVRTIRIPLLKGMLGNRIFIINQGEQAKFNAISSFEDLKKLSLGQGHDWPDTFILEAAGLKVEKSANYASLFTMLAAKRFAAFPRGINEPWSEVESHSMLHLEIEKKLAISYPAPLFFFVGLNNKALGDRIETGLQRAIKDGSFEKLFRKFWGNYLAKANMKARKVFKIGNPFLSDETRKVLEKHPEYVLHFD